jgi:hypothetical protein
MLAATLRLWKPYYVNLTNTYICSSSLIHVLYYLYTYLDFRGRALVILEQLSYMSYIDTLHIFTLFCYHYSNIELRSSLLNFTNLYTMSSEMQ